MTREEYIGAVCDILEVLPPEMVIQRLTADGYREFFSVRRGPQTNLPSSMRLIVNWREGEAGKERDTEKEHDRHCGLPGGKSDQRGPGAGIPSGTVYRYE